MTTGHNAKRRRRAVAVAAAIIVGVVLLGLGVAAARARVSDDDLPTRYYVSIGDSYAAGYRPGGASGTTNGDGYAYQVLDGLNRHGHWELKNFGCVGQTARGMQFDNGCAEGALAAGGVAYPDTTQEAAADQFIGAHRNEIGLITVAMGANDIIKCLDIEDAGAAQGCAEIAVADIRTSLSAFLTETRKLVGDKVPIVGVSYINVFRAGGMTGQPDGDRKAARSQVLFDNYLIPALRDTYAQFGARFVDTTELAGGQLPDTQKSLLPEHGTVSTGVARVCTLTYYCSDNDPHPNRAGHALIARAIQAAIE